MRNWKDSWWYIDFSRIDVDIEFIDIICVFEQLLDVCVYLDNFFEVYTESSFFIENDSKIHKKSQFI